MHRRLAAERQRWRPSAMPSASCGPRGDARPRPLARPGARTASPRASRPHGQRRQRRHGGPLSVSVGYAEDKEINTPDPAAFPVPWAGAPNTIFLGGTVPGPGRVRHAHGLLRHGRDQARQHRDDADHVSATSPWTSTPSIPGGKLFNNLWGSFTVPPGKSVILTANPPANNPGYDNFDTSGYPATTARRSPSRPLSPSRSAASPPRWRTARTCSTPAASTRATARPSTTSRSSGGRSAPRGPADAHAEPRPATVTGSPGSRSPRPPTLLDGNGRRACRTRSSTSP